MVILSNTPVMSKSIWVNTIFVLSACNSSVFVMIWPCHWICSMSIAFHFGFKVGYQIFAACITSCNTDSRIKTPCLNYLFLVEKQSTTTVHDLLQWVEFNKKIFKWNIHIWYSFVTNEVMKIKNEKNLYIK